MELSKPKTLLWTKHSKEKMRFYNLSESRVKRVLRLPKRIEVGIAPETIAMMQSAGTPKNPYEIWVMIDNEKAQKKVISAWRYPGETKEKDEKIFNAISSEYSDYQES